MLSAADFSDLFPWIFAPDETDLPDPPQQLRSRPNEACIARWEDDGGTTDAAANHVSRPPFS